MHGSAWSHVGAVIALWIEYVYSTHVLDGVACYVLSLLH
jgi:hypothetical protein